MLYCNCNYYYYYLMFVDFIVAKMILSYVCILYILKLRLNCLAIVCFLG